MPGNPEASVLLLVKDSPTTVVPTGALATDLDETRYERGHGPCLHAARTGELTEIADTRTDDPGSGTGGCNAPGYPTLPPTRWCGRSPALSVR